MSERGLPSADGAHACPFVAFEDDRDERSTVPDHRHRCYAEVRPAPRALAHQEAYCLSASFPVCPTFQDWARRESARARDAAAAAASTAATPEPVADEPIDAPIVGAGLAASAAAAMPEPLAESAPRETGALWGAAAERRDEADEADEADEEREPGPPPDERAHRNPPRDWSAPPPWLASAEAANRSTAPNEPPDFLARRSEPGQGLAGSPADLLAGGSPPARPPSAASRVTTPSPAPRTPASARGEDLGEPDWDARDLPRPATPSRRPRAYSQHLGGPSDGPDWERPRRYEAYPTIKARIGMPQIPRLALMAAAVAIAALALFFLPALLGLGQDEGAVSSPSPSAAPSRSIAPTPTPLPTPIVYVVKTGDTLSKIAVEHGVTVDQILAANPDITNPNRITLGQQITIPVPSPSVPEVVGGSESPAASGAAVP
ncbi:MAG TPA: LysM peptidoglycan-binding domain-containing protein [Candidatus Limnocylindrales bacterium]|nr:LysM peptidoglycan-binding domain-containing protein [Candidatus Limnocylindrales bacterium]